MQEEPDRETGSSAMTNPLASFLSHPSDQQLKLEDENFGEKKVKTPRNQNSNDDSHNDLPDMRAISMKTQDLSATIKAKNLTDKRGQHQSSITIKKKDSHLSHNESFQKSMNATSLLNLLQNKKLQITSEKIASDIDVSSQSAVGKELTVRQINPTKRVPVDRQLSS